MNKILKGFIIFIVIVSFLGALMDSDDGNDVASAEDDVQDMAGVNTAVESDPVESFADQVSDEIDESGADFWVDSYTVEYNEITRALMVDVDKESVWDAEQLRNSMMYFTFEMMPVAVEHADVADNVFITGYAPMLDTKGNSEMTKVYMVYVSTESAAEVNWENLKYMDMMQALENNFDTVYWHPGVLG